VCFFVKRGFIEFGPKYGLFTGYSQVFPQKENAGIAKFDQKEQDVVKFYPWRNWTYRGVSGSLPAKHRFGLENNLFILF
jgi:hypothetical protein